MRAQGTGGKGLQAAGVMRVGRVICMLSVLLLCGETRQALAQGQPQVFSTWEGFEADKCASIWLITRFVAKEASIRFFPKGSPITEGIAFDTPDAKLRRYHNLCTFESILKEYRLENPKLVHIGRIIHDIEINLWGMKRMNESREVQEAIDRIIATSKGNEDVVERSCLFFDGLYHSLQGR